MKVKVVIDSISSVPQTNRKKKLAQGYKNEVWGIIGCTKNCSHCQSTVPQYANIKLIRCWLVVFIMQMICTVVVCIVHIALLECTFFARGTRVQQPVGVGGGGGLRLLGKKPLLILWPPGNCAYDCHLGS